ncbi:MAG TPA: CBS domain-containing protein [Candidatus Dormibacteraeota bacterium]|jgi:CBS domain-containing protein
MALKVRDVMTVRPVAIEEEASVVEAARAMRDGNFGSIIVLKAHGGAVCGIVTDRDIAIRVVAEGVDPSAVRLADICEGEIVTVGPDEPVDEVARLMRDKAIRRVPVVDGERLVGVVSLGDLAKKIDEGRVLADISAAPPTAPGARLSLDK